MVTEYSLSAPSSVQMNGIDSITCEMNKASRKVVRMTRPYQMCSIREHWIRAASWPRTSMNNSFLHSLSNNNHSFFSWTKNLSTLWRSELPFAGLRYKTCWWPNTFVGSSMTLSTVEFVRRFALVQNSKSWSAHFWNIPCDTLNVPY